MNLQTNIEQSNHFSLNQTMKESFNEVNLKDSTSKYRPEYSEILPMLESQSVDRLKSINKKTSLESETKVEPIPKEETKVEPIPKEVGRDEEINLQ